MGLLNLRNALMTGKRTPTAKDYVQDGLLLMFDGIENAGWGTHNPSATVWKDLSGNGYDFSLEGVSYSFSGNSLILGTGESISRSGSLCVSHIDIVFSASKGSPFFTGKLLNTGYSYLGVLIRYKYIGFNHNTYAQILTDNNIPFAAYSLHSGSIYKNGIAQSIISTAAPGDIGYLAIRTKDSQGHTLTCSLRNIRLYSRALTADEIARNYAIDKERFNLP